MRFFASTTPPTTPVSIAENGGVATLTLTLDRAIPMGDSVLIFPYTITGTGISANDITADSLTGSITVAAGSATGTLTITAVDNGMMEGDKTMTITLGALPSGITATGIAPVEITIIDDETPPASVRNFVASTTPPTTPVSIAEDGGEATLTLTLDRAIPMGDSNLPFPYTITEIDAGDITAMQDSEDEGASETMTVTLGTLPSGITATGIGSVEIIITDDDATPTQVTGFAITSGSSPIAEDGGSVTITLTLDSSIPSGEGALVFPYTIADSTTLANTVNANGIVVADISGSLSGDISVAEGSNTGTLVITAVDDSVDEGASETMTITLGTLPSSIMAATSIGSVEIIITDDDLSVSSFRVTPNPLTLPVAATVPEANGRTLTLTLILNGNAARDLMFPLTITASPANAFVCVVGVVFGITCVGEFINTQTSAIAIPTVPMGSDRISIDYTVAALEVSLRPIPTAYTFSIRLPSGIADGGDDLSERVDLITTR